MGRRRLIKRQLAIIYSVTRVFDSLHIVYLAKRQMTDMHKHKTLPNFIKAIGVLLARNEKAENTIFLSQHCEILDLALWKTN